VPYRVIRFQSPGALRRYAPRDERGRPQQFVGGYFSSDPDLNVIALGGGSTDVVFTSSPIPSWRGTSTRCRRG
jgi:hypothetical protein